MSRVKRTQQFRKTVEKQWTLKYWNFIQENPDKPWDWRAISMNPNITMDIIRENLDRPWDWYWISHNIFQKEKELFIENAYKEHLAAYRIQQWWYKITLSPNYVIGRKFINRKYDKLFM